MTLSYRAGVLLVVTAGVLWSLQGLLIRQIVEAESWAVLFWRSLGMAPVLAAFLLLKDGVSPLRGIQKSGRTAVLGGLAVVGSSGGAIYALQATTVANAVFLFAASPLIAAFLGRVVLKERVPALTCAAIAIALLGVVIMVGEGLATGAMEGSVAALISALSFALFTVTVRAGGERDPVPSVLLGSIFAAVFGAVLVTQTGQAILVPPADALWALALGAFTLTGGLIAYSIGSKVIRAAEATLIANIEVVLGPVWVWVFYGEGASANTLAGGAVILAALVLNSYANASLRTRQKA